MTDPSETDTPDFASLRIEYMLKSLDEGDVDENPIRQFLLWLNESIATGAHEPNAMTLATSTPDGIPSARVVLLKSVDDRGFLFFTNYLSRKGREIDANPVGALLFYWPELQRQVRVEGKIARTTPEESAEYFNSRPVDARYGSAASPQSEPIESRQTLESLNEQLRARYPDGNIPCPAHWGGYRLNPTRLEFWQGRLSRLHDRIECIRDPQSHWTRRRLAP